MRQGEAAWIAEARAQLLRGMGLSLRDRSAEVPDNRASQGYVCTRKVTFTHEDEAFERPCGKCRACIASKKANAIGAVVAEVLTTRYFVFLMGTFAGPVGTGPVEDAWRVFDSFRYRSHTQMKRRGVHQRHFATIERGPRNTRRWHIHAGLFLSGDPGFGPQASKPGARNDWRKPDRWWKAGRYTVEVVEVAKASQSEITRMARYIGKYCFKHFGTAATGKVEVGRVRRSTGRRIVMEPQLNGTVVPRIMGEPLGTRLYEQDGERYAKSGLPLPEHIAIPGNTFRRTGKNRLGQTVTIDATGRTVAYGRLAYYRREAFKRAWVQRTGNDNWPVSDYMAYADEEHVFRPHKLSKSMREMRQAAKLTAEELARNDEARALMERRQKALRAKDGRLGREAYRPLLDARGGVIAMLHMKPNGYVRCTVQQERYVETGVRVRYADMSVPVRNGSLRGVLRLTDEAHGEVERWVREGRGEDWLPPDEWAALNQRLKEIRNEACARFSPVHMATREKPSVLSRIGRLVRLRAIAPDRFDEDTGEPIRDGPVRGGRREIALREFRKSA